jgi:hypothetical protein
LNPFCGVTLMVLVLLPPWTIFRLLGVAESVKLGTRLMATEIVVLLVKPPDVPVITTENVPVVAVLLAFNVSVLEAAAGFGLKDALTPLGRPIADRLTLPTKPLRDVTVIVLVPLAP